MTTGPHDDALRAHWTLEGSIPLSGVPAGASWHRARSVATGEDVVVLLAEGTAALEVADAARRAFLVEDPRLIPVREVRVFGDPREDPQAAAPGAAAPLTAVEYPVPPAPPLAAMYAKGPLRAETARSVIGEAASGLDTARRRGIRHQHLDSNRLFVDPVAGTVHVLGTGVEAAASPVASADEQDASFRDTAALVALLYKAITGTRPSRGADGRVPRASSVSPRRVPEDLDVLCDVVLNESSPDMPLTVRDLVAELSPWQSIPVTLEAFDADDAAAAAAGTSANPGPAAGEAAPAAAAPAAAAPAAAAPASVAPAAAPAVGAAGAAAAGAGAAAAGAAAAAHGAPDGPAEGPAAPSAPPAAPQSLAADVAPPAATTGDSAEVTDPAATAPMAPLGTEPPTAAQQPGAQQHGPAAQQTGPAPQDAPAPDAAHGAPADPAGAAGAHAPGGPAAPAGEHVASEPAEHAAHLSPQERARAAEEASTLVRELHLDEPRRGAAFPGHLDVHPPAPAPAPTADPTPAPTADPSAAAAAAPAPTPVPGVPAEPSAPSTMPLAPVPGQPAAAPSDPDPMSTPAQAPEPDVEDGDQVPSAPAASAPAATVPGAAAAGATAAGAAASAAAASAAGSSAPGSQSSQPAGPGDEPVTVRLAPAASGESTDEVPPQPGGPIIVRGRDTSLAEEATEIRPVPAAHSSLLRDVVGVAMDREEAVTYAQTPVPRDQRSRTAQWVLALAVLGVIVALVFAITSITSTLRGGTSAPVGEETTSAAASPSPTPTEEAPEQTTPEALPVVTIGSAELFSRGTDNEPDHLERQERLTDGDPSSAWSSQIYRSAQYGNLKEGLGVRLTFPEPGTLNAVVVTTAQNSGGVIELRADPGNGELGEVLASGQFAGDGDVTLTPKEPLTEASSVVLWIPELPSDSEGDGFRARIAEVRVQ